ncbi:MAG: trypsin-like serine protease [Phycisphaerales bacterium]
MGKLCNVVAACSIAGVFASWDATNVVAGTIVVGASPDAYTELAQDSAYDAVGMFSWDGGLASGTYIGDGWVLTAAHVAESSSSLTFTVGGQAYTSSEIIINDAWTGDVSLGGDMALVKLSTDITGVTAAQLYDPSIIGATDTDASETTSLINGIPGIDLQGQGFGPFGGFGRRGGFGHHGGFGRFGRHGGFGGMFPYPGDDDGSMDLIGQVITMVGYGMTGDGETGAVEEGGNKIAGQNTIDWTGRMLRGYDDSLLFVDFDDPDADNNKWSRYFGASDAVDLEYLIAGGDSGGGVFIEGEDGTSYLLAVNSFLLAFDGSIDADYGDLAAFTSVVNYLDWIYEVTGLNSTDTASAVLEQTVLVIPEPSAALLMGLTQTLVLIALRRRDI